MARTRNVQVVDGALNCTYDIFSLTAEEFRLLFPAPGQDIEFAEDVVDRLGEKATAIFDAMWRSRVPKSEVRGIHGTLFFGLEDKKAFYPTKREEEMVTGL